MKIEIDKPVVPKFVADWIEQLYGQGFNSDDLLEVLFARNYNVAELRIFDWFVDDKERAVAAILYGYEVEKEPLYYAKIKGWEILGGGFKWVYLENSKELIIGDVIFPDDETEAMTKEEWNKVGINDTNADFEEVE